MAAQDDLAARLAALETQMRALAERVRAIEQATYLVDAEIVEPVPPTAGPDRVDPGGGEEGARPTDAPAVAETDDGARPTDAPAAAETDDEVEGAWW
jgi:hypothetical protein